MVRGNGSARAETSVKAAATPNTIRIRMRRGRLRDTLDDDLSAITFSRLSPPSPCPWSDPFRLARDAQHNRLLTPMHRIRSPCCALAATAKPELRYRTA